MMFQIYKVIVEGLTRQWSSFSALLIPPLFFNYLKKCGSVISDLPVSSVVCLHLAVAARTKCRMYSYGFTSTMRKNCMYIFVLCSCNPLLWEVAFLF